MVTEYLRALISATTEEEANHMLKTLLNERLVAGGLITKGFSNHWWGGRIDTKIYYNISAFTTKENKDKLIELVENLSKDDTPIITFFKIDYASEKTFSWIKNNVKP